MSLYSYPSPLTKMDLRSTVDLNVRTVLKNFWKKMYENIFITSELVKVFFPVGYRKTATFKNATNWISSKLKVCALLRDGIGKSQQKI